MRSRHICFIILNIKNLEQDHQIISNLFNKSNQCNQIQVRRLVLKSTPWWLWPCSGSIAITIVSFWCEGTFRCLEFARPTCTAKTLTSLRSGLPGPTSQTIAPPSASTPGSPTLSNASPELPIFRIFSKFYKIANGKENSQYQKKQKHFPLSDFLWNSFILYRCLLWNTCT